MANPIFDSDRFRRDLPEARALEEELRLRFLDVDDARVIAGGAGFDTTTINLTSAPSTFWAAILDHAGKMKAVQALVDSVEGELRPAPKDSEMRAEQGKLIAIHRSGGVPQKLAGADPAKKNEGCARQHHRRERPAVTRE